MPIFFWLISIVNGRVSEDVGLGFLFVAADIVVFVVAIIDGEVCVECSCFTLTQLV